jgi:predicted nucleic acid-binding protein
LKAFLDTFALIEMLDGTKAFMPYLRDGVTSHVNLVEFHANACRLRGEAEADAKLRRLLPKAISVEAADVREASLVKRTVKGSSTVDALGYAMAQRRKIPFVTGDKAFRGLPGVLP